MLKHWTSVLRKTSQFSVGSVVCYKKRRMTAAERRRRFHSNLSGVLALLMLDEEERISVVGACFKHRISVMKSSLVVLIKEKSRWWVDVEIGVEMRMENTGGKQTTAHRKWQTVLWVRYSARGEVDDKNKKLLSARHLRKGQYWMNWCLNWRKPQANCWWPIYYH